MEDLITKFMELLIFVPYIKYEKDHELEPYAEQPGALRRYKTKSQQPLQRTTPPSKGTDSDRVISCLYPLGHAMIPSSGIMPSLGDRCDNNCGATT
jgi:hypothetical protein